MTKDNHLGKFDLTGIPPAPGYAPDRGSHLTWTPTVSLMCPPSIRCPEAGEDHHTNDKRRRLQGRFERMVNDAEKFKDEDDAQRREITAKNGLESYIFNMKSALDQDQVKAKLGEADLIQRPRPSWTKPWPGWTRTSWGEGRVRREAEGAGAGLKAKRRRRCTGVLENNLSNPLAEPGQR